MKQIVSLGYVYHYWVWGVIVMDVVANVPVPITVMTVDNTCMMNLDLM
jgi:hypothetical protein